MNCWAHTRIPLLCSHDRVGHCHHIQILRNLSGSDYERYLYTIQHPGIQDLHFQVLSQWWFLPDLKNILCCCIIYPDSFRRDHHYNNSRCDMQQILQELTE